MLHDNIVLADLKKGDRVIFHADRDDDKPKIYTVYEAYGNLVTLAKTDEPDKPAIVQWHRKSFIKLDT